MAPRGGREEAGDRLSSGLQEETGRGGHSLETQGQHPGQGLPGAAGLTRTCSLRQGCSVRTQERRCPPPGGVESLSEVIQGRPGRVGKCKRSASLRPHKHWAPWHSPVAGGTVGPEPNRTSQTSGSPPARRAGKTPREAGQAEDPSWLWGTLATHASHLLPAGKGLCSSWRSRTSRQVPQSKFSKHQYLLGEYFMNEERRCELGALRNENLSTRPNNEEA